MYSTYSVVFQLCGAVVTTPCLVSTNMVGTRQPLDSSVKHWKTSRVAVSHVNSIRTAHLDGDGKGEERSVASRRGAERGGAEH